MDDASAFPAPEAPGLLPPPPALVPFEDEGIPGFWARVGGMFQLLFSEPLALFERVPRGDKFGPPWRFLLLLSVPAFLLLGLIFGAFGFAALVGALADRGADTKFLAILPAVFLVILALLPVLLFVGMLVGGALDHFFLWIWGGLKDGEALESTIRAVGYANAFIQLGAWIPYLGFLVQLAGRIWLGAGLARMHRTQTWRGICAVLTPLFLLCGCLFLLLLCLPLALLAARS
ncbi:MAG: hypothetical protein HY823_01190 [Acidobacteria bacterium]|nr:hypothetical protein [Acidobacteriota bacterium]